MSVVRIVAIALLVAAARAYAIQPLTCGPLTLGTTVTGCTKDLFAGQYKYCNGYYALATKSGCDWVGGAGCTFPPVQSVTRAQCEQLCRAEPGCTAFTYFCSINVCNLHLMEQPWSYTSAQASAGVYSVISSTCTGVVSEYGGCSNPPFTPVPPTPQPPNPPTPQPTIPPAAALFIGTVTATPTTGSIQTKAYTGAPQGNYIAFDTTFDVANQNNGVAQPAVAKDTIAGHASIHAARYANNGLYGNGDSWIGTSANSWIKIDLGAQFLIGSFRFGRDRTGTFDDRDPGQFTFSVALSDNVYANGDESNDAQEYTTVLSSNSLGFSGIISGSATVEGRFSGVLARYVKFSFQNAGAAIDDIEVRLATGTCGPLTLGTTVNGCYKDLFAGRYIYCNGYYPLATKSGCDWGGSACTFPPVQYVSRAQCEQLCRAEPGCTAFTYFCSLSICNLHLMQQPWSYTSAQVSAGVYSVISDTCTGIVSEYSGCSNGPFTPAPVPPPPQARTLGTVSATPPTGTLLTKPGAGAPQGNYIAFDTTFDVANQNNGVARAAVAKDTIAGYPGIHAAAYANNGFYGNGDSWIGTSANSWIKIDLGAQFTIGSFRFGRDRTFVYDDRDPGQFTFATALSDNVYANGDESNDVQEYTTLLFSNTLGFSGSISYGATVQGTFPGVLARYVKFSFQNAGAAIDDIEVFLA